MEVFKPELFDIYFGQDPSQMPLPEQTPRKIIHIDMDAFYASIEERENPKLKDLPLVIGGSPESRSVVCTANYKARGFGVKSAIPCSQAYKLCPQAIFLPPRFSLYKAESKKIFTIFHEITSKIQPLSLDEAYLDVTDVQSHQSATEIALYLKNEIYKRTSLTASAGVAPNKLIAKIASDINKPNGIFIVKPQQTKYFMKNLSVKKIPGIGPATFDKLKAMNIKTCSDVWLTNFQTLEQNMGHKFASWLWISSHGIDNREVKFEQKRKSISSEETFSIDLIKPEEIKAKLQEISLDVAKQSQKLDTIGRTINLKLRYNDFKTLTRSKTLNIYTNDFNQIQQVALELFEQIELLPVPVRLLGVGLNNLQDNIQHGPPLQLELN